MTPFADTPARSALLRQMKFIVGCSWRETVDTRLTADRVLSVDNSLRALLVEGFRVAILSEPDGPWRTRGYEMRLVIEARQLHWRTNPLELLVGISIHAAQDDWSGNPDGTPDQHPGRDIAERLRERLQAVAARAGQAVAQVLGGLELLTTRVDLVSGGGLQTKGIHLQPEDIEAVRLEHVPVEYGLLFELLAATPGRMMTLADLLAVAGSKSLDDEAVLGSVNFFSDKGYLLFDRTHQVVKLTDHGRAASSNSGL